MAHRKIKKLCINFCMHGYHSKHLECVCMSSSATKHVPYPALHRLLLLRVRPVNLRVVRVRPLSTFIPKKRTYYEILGITRVASASDIRQAYIKLSKQCHPDTNRNDPSNHKKFVKINEAYATLSKPLSRRDYDTTLDADRYVAQHMNNKAYRSHTYGQHPYAGHYYHHHNHFYDETSWSRQQYYKQDESGRALVNFYIITLCITSVVVISILHYMHKYVPSTRLHGLRKSLNKEDIEKHELIMTSKHDGMTVYYYAVPNENDPKSFEVLAVERSEMKDSDKHELHELNNINFSNRYTSQG